jgi:hypothetical protein
MSPFREALKAAGHGEWVIEMISASGEVRLRKINECALEVHLALAPSVHLAIAPSTEDGIVLTAAA